MTSTLSSDRCRLVLIAPPGIGSAKLAASVRKAINGGDVASLILPQYDLDEIAFQDLAEAVTPIAQEAGVAVIISGDTRIAGRVKADGIHIEVRAEIAEAIEKYQGKMAVGTGGVKTRDEALAIGEMRPDYLFFGRFGYDTKPEAHSRNLGLGRWWAEMIEIPCIVLAGSEIGSVADVASTGAEFVAVSLAVFGDGIDPRAAVAQANAILDAESPHFDGSD